MTDRRRRGPINLSSSTDDNERVGPRRNGDRIDPRTVLLVLMTVAACVVLAIVLFGRWAPRERPPVVDRLMVETNAALPSGHAWGPSWCSGCRPRSG